MALNTTNFGSSFLHSRVSRDPLLKRGPTFLPSLDPPEGYEHENHLEVLSVRSSCHQIPRGSGAGAAAAFCFLLQKVESYKAASLFWCISWIRFVLVD